MAWAQIKMFVVVVEGDPPELGSISPRFGEDPLGGRLERKAALQEGADTCGHAMLHDFFTNSGDRNRAQAIGEICRNCRRV